MATWKTEINKVGSDISNFFNTAANKVSDAFTTSTNQVIADVKSFFSNGTSVVGIKVSGIGSMQHAITKYVAGIDAAIGELKNAETNIAFKGEYAKAIRGYIEALIEVCQAISSQMLVFGDELTKVEEAYHSKDTTSASQISQEAESARSAYTRYGATSQS